MADSEKPIFGFKFSLAETLELWKVALKRFADVTIEEIEREWLGDETPNGLDEVFISAYLRELLRRCADAYKLPALFKRAQTLEGINDQLRLAMKHFPERAEFFAQLMTPTFNEVEVKADVLQRLDSLKRRFADRFTKEFHDTIRTHEITSPVEQIFLMEWKFSDVERQHKVVLEPQSPIEVGTGTFFLDFLVRSTVSGGEELRVGIEIDGHEFHEKSKEQATRDRRRERQIVESGITLLRFSGSEVVRDARNCIDDIIRFLSRRGANEQA
jgi:very-short-patch-repair endonuclease